jgi:hypothetical protein
MTRSMQAMPGGAHKVLTTLRRLIPDGARRKIPQNEIAKKACVSEGTVSSAMRLLDGPYLIRHPLGRGRGRGYEIELLPPPEQRPPAALSTPQKGSISDPCDRSFSSGVPTPQEAAQKGSEIEPSTFSLHAHEQQQQTATPPDATNEPEPAAQLAPETIAALKAANADAKVIARVAANFPACTPDDVAQALARAPQKPNSYLPPGLALHCLSYGQEIALPRQTVSGGKQRAAVKAIDVSNYRSDPLYTVGDADEPSEAELLTDLDEALRDEEAADLPPAAPPASSPSPAAPPPGQDLAALIAEALALLDDAPPDTVERGRISYLIRQERRSPAQAADTLRAERERRSRPKNRAQARRLTGGP